MPDFDGATTSMEDKANVVPEPEVVNEGESGVVLLVAHKDQEPTKQECVLDGKGDLAIENNDLEHPSCALEHPMDALPQEPEEHALCVPSLVEKPRAS